MNGCYDCDHSTSGLCWRHRARLIAFVCFLLAGCALVGAQAWASPPDAGVSTAASAIPVVAAPATTPPACDIPCELGKLRIAYDAMQASGQGAPGAKHIAIAALVAVVLRVLMQLVERLLGWDRLHAGKKRWLPLILLGLGAATAVVMHYAAGEGWPMALLYGATGPGAVFANELMNLWPQKKEPARLAGP